MENKSSLAVILQFILTVEICFIVFLMLPIADPKNWTYFFTSRPFSAVYEYGNIIFGFVLGVLTALLMHALEEKYVIVDDVASDKKTTNDAQWNVNVALLVMVLWVTIKCLLIEMTAVAIQTNKTEQLNKKEKREELSRRLLLEQECKIKSIRDDVALWKSSYEELLDKVKRSETSGVPGASLTTIQAAGPSNCNQ